MPLRILVIDGHPDPDRARLCHALADAYAEAAAAAGHEIRRIDVARIEVPVLRSPRTWEQEPPAPAIAECQAAIAWAQHLVIVFPLWLGAMPALLKAFREQVFLPGFAIAHDLYRAHGLRSLERNVLQYCGIRPVRATLIGRVEAGGAAARGLAAVRALGRAGR